MRIFTFAEEMRAKSFQKNFENSRTEIWQHISKYDPRIMLVNAGHQSVRKMLANCDVLVEDMFGPFKEIWLSSGLFDQYLVNQERIKEIGFLPTSAFIVKVDDSDEFIEKFYEGHEEKFVYKGMVRIRYGEQDGTLIKDAVTKNTLYTIRLSNNVLVICHGSVLMRSLKMIFHTIPMNLEHVPEKDEIFSFNNRTKFKTFIKNGKDFQSSDLGYFPYDTKWASVVAGDILPTFRERLILKLFGFGRITGKRLRLLVKCDPLENFNQFDFDNFSAFLTEVMKQNFVLSVDYWNTLFIGAFRKQLGEITNEHFEGHVVYKIESKGLYFILLKPFKKVIFSSNLEALKQNIDDPDFTSPPNYIAQGDTTLTKLMFKLYCKKAKIDWDTIEEFFKKSDLEIPSIQYKDTQLNLINLFKN